MIYPTYQSKNNQVVHIVEDQQICLCGLKHHSFYELNRKDLRSIVFKPVDNVTCEDCLDKFKDFS
ncbi:hypothetical protein [Bacillus sp. CECT 9360]|uniref:hypothetical protein n=1 Tax=Bacillus sp. CECT 9360 TaxID=2845821 RepID=UPI001E535779|nr:hypothetical protein [Bacillus sp. CECT 9360]CAH0344843.1 hypothetical protein BCI9360_01113 [Bacillus sp. CECT 9360]